MVVVFASILVCLIMVLLIVFCMFKRKRENTAMKIKVAALSNTMTINDLKKEEDHMEALSFQSHESITPALSELSKVTRVSHI